MNDFTFGNETKNPVFTHHHERANILCAEPVAALLMVASGAIVVTSVPFRLRMLSMDIALLQSCSLAAYLIDICGSTDLGLAPAIGRMLMEFLYEEH